MGVGKPATKIVGDAAEALALAHVSSRGMRLIQRNYRVAAGPRRRGGEIDLICRDSDGTLVFVEVRRRASASHGGAAASIGSAKQRRIVFAAQHFLRTLPQLPACRFDVVAIDGESIEWLKAAFSA
jgi:putative endonuclease